MDFSRNQPEPSSHPNAYRMQGGAAGARLAEAFPCLHSGCETLCSNEQSLSEHMEIYHPVAYDVTDFTYHRPISQASGGHIYDYSTVGYPSPYDSTTATLATHTSNSHGMTYPPVTGYDFQNVAPYQHIGSDNSHGPPPATSFQPAAVASSTAPAIANGRLSCSHFGCTETFVRKCDLNRHAKKHQVGPKDLDCPVRGCRRKGASGFTRRDKLMDHLKAKHKW